MFDGNCAVARRLAEYNSGCKSDIKTIHLLNRLMGAHTDNSIIIWSILMGPSCPRWIMPAAGPHTAQCGVLCVPSEMSLVMFEVGGERMRIISLTRGVQHRAVNNHSRFHISLLREAFNKRKECF